MEKFRERCLCVARLLQKGKFNYETAYESVLERYSVSGIMVWYHPIDDNFRYIEFIRDSADVYGSRTFSFDQFPNEIDEYELEKYMEMLDDAEHQIKVDVRNHNLTKNQFYWLSGYTTVEQPEWITASGSNALIVSDDNASIVLLRNGEFIDPVGSEKDILVLINRVKKLMKGVI